MIVHHPSLLVLPLLGEALGTRDRNTQFWVGTGLGGEVGGGKEERSLKESFLSWLLFFSVFLQWP